MNTTGLMPRRNLGRIYALEAKYEFLKLFRLPAFAIPSLTFPLLFYVLFGLGFGGGKMAGSVSLPAYMLATYGVFGVVGAALFGFGVSIATERGQGWMSLKRASPMPPLAYFTAKIAMSLLFGSLIVLGLFTLAATVGDVRLATSTWATLAAVLAAGAFPFCALGLVLGYISGPNSAPAIVNLIYLPMAFASGLWMPIQILPEFVQKIATFLPPYYLAQWALGIIGAETAEPVWKCVLALIGFTVLFLFLASLAYRRDEGKTYG